MRIANIFLMVFLFAVAGAYAADESYFKFEDFSGSLPLRPGNYATLLKDALVVAPADEKSQTLARKIADKLGIKLVGADEAVKGRCKGLTDKCINSNLILLGNINNNAAIIPLYAKFLSWADADYPGNGGYAVRTIRNPYGSLKNNILLEASDYSGLEKAVDAFLKAPQLDIATGKCDYVFEVKPMLPKAADEEIAKLAGKISVFIKKGAVDNEGVEIGQFAVAYYLTGKKQFEQPLKAYAEKITEKTCPAFAVGHYYWENFLRALEIITNVNLVDEQTVRKMDVNLFLSLYKMRSDYGIRRNQEPPGGRHQLPPTCAYMMFCDLLRRNLFPKTSPNIKDFLDFNYNSTANYFRYLSTCSVAGGDDSSSIAANMTSVMQAAFVIGDMTLFENGLGMEGAKKMICTVDNWGYGTGTGIYEDAYEEGMTKKPYSNGGPVCYSAFYYQDPGLEWVKQNVKGMRFDSWFGQTWFGLHKYATGDYLKAVKPEGKYMTTSCRPTNLFALKDYQDLSAFPKDRLFDKAVIRSGSAPEDAYICFQGNGSGKEGLMNDVSDTLVLLRYADRGVLWLANNSQLTGGAWRNSFIVSDSSSDSAGAMPIARLDFIGKIEGGTGFVATVPGVRHGNWTRRAIRFDDGDLLVADTFESKKDGDYSFLQTFKTPVPAKIIDSGTRVVAAEAGYQMSIIGSSGTRLTIDNGIRRMEPQDFWYFRRSIDRRLQKNEKLTVASLFSIKTITKNDKPLKIIEISPEKFIVTNGDNCREITFENEKISINRVASLLEKTLDSAITWKAELLTVKTEIPGDFSTVPVFIHGWKVISPKLLQADAISDNAVKRWDPGCGYDVKEPLVIDLGKPDNLAGIKLFTVTRSLEKELKPYPSISVKVETSANSDFNGAKMNPVELKFTPDIRDLYKITTWEVTGFTGELKAKNIRYLRIVGLPERIAELILISDSRENARVLKIKSADLDGDDSDEVLVETNDRQISAFDANGKRQFSIQLPFEIIDFAAAPLDGARKMQILVICEDQKLYKYNYDGKLLSGIPLFQRPCSMTVLKSKDGSHKIAVCYYYHFQFFSTDLKAMDNPKGFGAMWTENIKAADLDKDSNDDLVMTDIYGRGYTVNGLSGEISKIFSATSGIDNDIFMTTEQGVVFAGQNQVKCMKLGLGAEFEAKETWKYSNGDQYSAAAFHGNLLSISRLCGHVIGLDANTGSVKNSIWAKGRIFAIDTNGDKLYVATDDGLHCYDRQGKEVNFFPGIISHLKCTDRGIFVVANDHLKILNYK